MKIIQFALLLFVVAASFRPAQEKEREEVKIVQDLFRLRNEHKADSAERYFADTVKVYMKYLRNVPKQTVTKSDKLFWKQHPGNRFEIILPIQVTARPEGAVAIVTGKEYLDGTQFQKERIEIRFNRNKKIYYYRGFLVK